MSSIFEQAQALAEAEQPALRSFKLAAASERARSVRARAQRREWEKHLEGRILLNAVLKVVNALPSNTALQRASKRSKKVEALRSQLDSSLGSAAEALAAALAAQDAHFRRRGKLRGDADASARKRKRENGLEGQLEDFSERLRRLRPFWSDTIEEWRAKTRVTSSKAKFRVVDQGVMDQVDELVAEDARFRRRAFRPLQESRAERLRLDAAAGDGEAEPNGEREAEEEEDAVDEDVYDDAVFYQLLLRDFTDAASGGSKSVSGGLRPARKKSKSGVDRKASKGRRLRYNLHPKLENFMYPVTNGTCFAGNVSMIPTPLSTLIDAVVDAFVPDAATLGIDLDSLFGSLLGRTPAAEANGSNALDLPGETN